jgi:hypothetical protein
MAERSAFEEVARFVAEGGILVQKLKSKNTGLTIIKADVEGTLIKRSFHSNRILYDTETIYAIA